MFLYTATLIVYRRIKLVEEIRFKLIIRILRCGVHAEAACIWALFPNTNMSVNDDMGGISSCVSLEVPTHTALKHFVILLFSYYSAHFQHYL
ncbi:hypothetical protein CEXT_784421 [Caerostris extrusa]|uniref:Uncharacterized protein n=1 Tax=Caerostris extrusa TaxID=172846 RepID=A0AAV4R2M4_CAEEX|nr:hypothetical protein CEXT_784421 [Caerostris extrusa]